VSHLVTSDEGTLQRASVPLRSRNHPGGQRRHAAGMTVVGPLLPGLDVCVLRARWAAASRCTNVLGRECKTSSLTCLVTCASPRPTVTVGARSCLAGLRDPHGCGPRHLIRTPLLGAASRHSSTGAASTACRTVTVGPPARVPRGVYAASTSTTSPGIASVCARRRLAALLPGLFTFRGASCAAVSRPPPRSCLAAPPWRFPHRGEMGLPGGAPLLGRHPPRS
jgi:hypothetical protein